MSFEGALLLLGGSGDRCRAPWQKGASPALGLPGAWPAAPGRPEGSGGGGRGAGAWLSEGQAVGILRRTLSRRGGGDRAVHSLPGQAGPGCHLEKQLRAGVHSLRKLQGPAGAGGRGGGELDPGSVPKERSAKGLG